MKHIATVAVLVSLVFIVGCTQKGQVKVTFLSDPPGGTLYKQNGEVSGPCPKTLWYDIDSKAADRGYMDIKGMLVRWPMGPEKKSEDPIKVTINGTDRKVIFLQPKIDEQSTVGDPRTDKKVDLDKKGAEWQKNRKLYSAESKRMRDSLALISKQPVAAGKTEKSLPGRTLTLEPKNLMLLDFSSLNRRGPSVKARRVVSGEGVEFDIHFPNNSPGSCSLSLVSSGTGGKGTLVGTDIRDYKAFALKITLVSINGQSDPDKKKKLVVGAVIGPTATGRLTSYEPVTLSLMPSEKTMTAITAVSAEEIYEIGFHVHIEDYQDWDPSGSNVVLRIEPAVGGETGKFNTAPN